MTRQSLNLTLLIFLLLTLSLLILLGYSLYMYFEVYSFSANFDIQVYFIKIENINRTYNRISSLLILRNPSKLSAKLTYLQAKFYLNNKLILEANRYFSLHPISVSPSSSFNISLSEFCLRESTKGLSSKREWTIKFQIVFHEVPITEKLLISRDVKWNG
ncbi:MAG: hypothetical protein ACTSV7_13785 [Candidatus Baldrarchaeia archaeon]